MIKKVDHPSKRNLWKSAIKLHLLWQLSTSKQPHSSTNSISSIWTTKRCAKTRRKPINKSVNSSKSKRREMISRLNSRSNKVLQISPSLKTTLNRLSRPSLMTDKVLSKLKGRKTTSSRGHKVIKKAKIAITKILTIKRQGDISKTFRIDKMTITNSSTIATPIKITIKTKALSSRIGIVDRVPIEISSIPNAGKINTNISSSMVTTTSILKVDKTTSKTSMEANRGSMSRDQRLKVTLAKLRTPQVSCLSHSIISSRLKMIIHSINQTRLQWLSSSHSLIHSFLKLPSLMEVPKLPTTSLQSPTTPQIRSQADRVRAFRQIKPIKITHSRRISTTNHSNFSPTRTNRGIIGHQTSIRVQARLLLSPK